MRSTASWQTDGVCKDSRLLGSRRVVEGVKVQGHVHVVLCVWLGAGHQKLLTHLWHVEFTSVVHASEGVTNVGSRFGFMCYGGPYVGS